MVARESAHDLLSCCLGFAVAGDDNALLSAHHELGWLWRVDTMEGATKHQLWAWLM